MQNEQHNPCNHNLIAHLYGGYVVQYNLNGHVEVNQYCHYKCNSSCGLWCWNDGVYDGVNYAGHSKYTEE